MHVVGPKLAVNRHLTCNLSGVSAATNAQSVQSARILMLAAVSDGVALPASSMQG